MTTAARNPTPSDFPAEYYGHGSGAPTANYRAYGEPHWADPLAAWLLAECKPPYLDVGAAFGHLVRDINRRASAGLPAIAVEWSAYATGQSVAEGCMLRADGLWLPLRSGSFGTVISMDFLEHHLPGKTILCLMEMGRVLERRGSMVHLIGWHHPKHDLAEHESDPTHLNHWPIAAYRRAIEELGFRLDKTRTIRLNLHPISRDTDWRGRWQVYQKV